MQVLLHMLHDYLQNPRNMGPSQVADDIFTPVFHQKAKVLVPRVRQDARPNSYGPNASQWNKVYVGTRGWVRIGHVDFMLIVSFLFPLGTQREHCFWWNIGLILRMQGLLG